MQTDNQQLTKVQTGDDQLKSSLNFTNTLTDKLAVFIINILGSMPFLIICIVIFTIWICWNTLLIPGLKPFDPFPFSTLEMAVSIFAVILSISVLINQNRQGRIEKIRQQVEFEVNVRAEHEITKLLNIVHDMHQKMGFDNTGDVELEEMKAKTNINEIHQSVDDKQSDAESLGTSEL